MATDGSAESALLAAVAMANNEAQATYQAALITSQNTAKAMTDVANIRAKADVEVAQIENGWHNQVATTEADAQRYVADQNREAAVESAHIDADARVAAADRAAQATEYAADAEKDGTVQAAQIRADADRQVAVTDADARRTVATTEADAQREVAVTRAQADTQVAQTSADAQRDVASTQAGAQVEAATIDAGWHNQVATTEGQFRVQVAQIDSTWHAQVAQIELTGTEFTASQQLAGVNAHESAESGRLATKLGFANAIYTDIKPVIQQIVNGISNSGGVLGGGNTHGFNPGQAFEPEPKSPMGFRMGPPAAGGAAAVAGYGSTRAPVMGPLDPPQDGGQASGGASAQSAVTLTAPYIAARGVLTPAMLQQQVNQAYSRNDARTQTQIRKAQGDLAGRGFSSNSPIIDALKVGYVTSNLRASIEAGSQIRLQAAQANVDATFRGQQARSEQYLAQEKVVLESQHNTIEQTVGILQAVGSLVGGIL